MSSSRPSFPSGLLDMGHGWSPTPTSVKAKAVQTTPQKSRTPRQRLFDAIAQNDVAAAKELLSKSAPFGILNDTTRKSLNIQLCACPSEDMVTLVSKAAKITPSHEKAVNDLLAQANPSPTDLENVLTNWVKKDGRHATKSPPPLAKAPNSPFPAFRHPQWVMEYDEEGERLHAPGGSGTAYDRCILDLYTRLVSMPKRRPPQKHQEILDVFERAIPTIPQDLLSLPSCALEVATKCFAGSPPHQATRQWWSKHATPLHAQKLFEGMLCSHIFANKLFDNLKDFKEFQAWITQDPSLKSSFEAAQRASAKASQIFETMLTTITSSPNFIHSKKAKELSANLGISLAQASAYWHRATILEKDMEYHVPFERRSASLTPSLDVVHHPSLLHAQVASGTEIGDLLEEIVATPQGAQAVAKCLEDEPTLQAWLQKSCLHDIIPLLTKVPSLVTWTDAAGNNVLHWLLEPRRVNISKNISKAENYSYFNPRIKELFKKTPQLLTQPNHRGITVLDVLGAADAISPSLHATLSQKILRTSLPTKTNKPKAFRRKM